MVTKRPFGVTKDGLEVSAYTITNGRGIAVTVLDYGATLQSVVLPCSNGPVDVVLGYDTVEAYEQNDGYLGASIGRFAGRIPEAMLRIGESVFPVTANEGKNHLHGGKTGFDRRIWKLDHYANKSVQFRLDASDGDEGYPGSVRFLATYSLEGSGLYIRYIGVSDRLTGWNPTNHAYWNLNGHDAGDARKHRLEIPAERYVPVGPDGIPNDRETDVAGTRYDFRTLREIDGAYDNCFVLSGKPIRLWGERGIGMEVRTDNTAVQLYNAAYLSERIGKCGAIYRPFGAVCLETEGRQTVPGSPIAAENVLNPGRHLALRETCYQFLYEEK
jgi:aldose 1-epimerase